ncbi:MAG: hypothetical protein ACYS26_10770 [Planctomycetota bacterium]|jgi:hypothetical protein
MARSLTPFGLALALISLWLTGCRDSADAGNAFSLEPGAGSSSVSETAAESLEIPDPDARAGSATGSAGGPFLQGSVPFAEAHVSRGDSLRIEVLDREGGPLLNARAIVRLDSGVAMRGQRGVAPTSRELFRGEFRGALDLDLPQGVRAVSVWAWAPGHDLKFEERSWKAGRAPERMVFRLRPGRVAHFEAVDAEGRGLEDVSLVSAKGRSRLLPLRSIAGPRPGEWFLRSLRATQQLLWLKNPVAGSALLDVDLEEHGFVDFGPVELCEGLGLRGRLTVAGTPLADVPLELPRPGGVTRFDEFEKVRRQASAPETDQSEPERWLTDDDGRFDVSSGALPQQELTLTRDYDPCGIFVRELLLAPEPYEVEVQGHWLDFDRSHLAPDDELVWLSFDFEHPEVPIGPIGMAMGRTRRKPGIGRIRGMLVPLGTSASCVGLVRTADRVEYLVHGEAPAVALPQVSQVFLGEDRSADVARLTVTVHSDVEEPEGRLSVNLNLSMGGTWSRDAHQGQPLAFGGLPAGDYQVRPGAHGTADAFFIPDQLSLKLEPGDDRSVEFELVQGVLPDLDLSQGLPPDMPADLPIRVRLESLDESRAEWNELRDLSQNASYGFHPVGEAFTGDGRNRYRALQWGGLYRHRQLIPPGPYRVLVSAGTSVEAGYWSWSDTVEWAPASRPVLRPVLERDSKD